MLASPVSQDGRRPDPGFFFLIQVRCRNLWTLWSEWYIKNRSARRKLMSRCWAASQWGFRGATVERWCRVSVNVTSLRRFRIHWESLDA